MISLVAVGGRVAGNLGRKVTTTTTLLGTVNQRAKHTPTFWEWVQTVEDHDCLRDWCHQLVTLGTTWDTFRRRDHDDIVHDFMQEGIPSLAARDIVRLASQEAARVNAPMAIFWDLENISIPSGVRGHDVAHALKTILKPHGQLVQFRGYGFKGIPPDKRSELHLSGCHLVDCPHGGRKDVVDKMILVDAMQFAYQNPDNATLCLVAGDIDYAYLLSVLQQNPNWRTIVISRGKQESLLRKISDITIQWETDILHSIEEKQEEMEQTVHHIDMVDVHGQENGGRVSLEDVDIQPKGIVRWEDIENDELVFSNGRAVVGKEHPETTITPNEVQDDVEMICHVMKLLQDEDGSSMPRKEIVGKKLRETFPSRFVISTNAVKAFLKQMISLGIVTEQGEKNNKTLVLSQEYKADSNYHSVATLRKIEMLRTVMVGLEARYGVTPRKDLVGLTLRQTFSSHFTRPDSPTVKMFLDDAIATGLVEEVGNGPGNVLVPLFPLHSKT